MQLLSGGIDPPPKVSQSFSGRAGPEKRQQTTGEGGTLTAPTRGEQLPTPVTYLHLSSFLPSALPKARCWKEDMGE